MRSIWTSTPACLPNSLAWASNSVSAVSDVEARERFPEGWNALRPYLRVVAQPR